MTSIVKIKLNQLSGFCVNTKTIKLTATMRTVTLIPKDKDDGNSDVTIRIVPSNPKIKMTATQMTIPWIPKIKKTT